MRPLMVGPVLKARLEELLPLLRKAFDESKVRRQPRGSPKGGQFMAQASGIPPRPQTTFWAAEEGNAPPVTGSLGSEEWEASLSTEEADALRAWCYNDWEFIMAASRAGDNAEEEVGWEYADMARAIEEALARAEPYDGAVWRSLARLTAEEAQALNSLAPGDIVTLKCLQSASADYEWTRGWIDAQGGVTERCAMLAIKQNLTGVDIANLSSEDQAEVLLRRGAQYRVEGVGPDGEGILTVYLSEVN